MTPISTRQLRIAVFLVSLVIIVLEISLMRELALRFWEHLAWLVISIALLGFGVSGTILVLLQKFFKTSSSLLQYCSLLMLALSLPLSLMTADKIEVDLIQMVWQRSQIWALGALEMAFVLPFLCGGMFIGLVLQDQPDNAGGYYAASFIGSAAGGILVLPVLYVLAPRMIVVGCAILIIATSLFYVRGWVMAVTWTGAVISLAAVAYYFPYESQIARDKDLPQILAMPDSKIVVERHSPQGLVQLVEAPAVHGGLGLSLSNDKAIPGQQLVMIDGMVGGSLFQSGADEDFAFLDNTTQALPYHLADFAEVLIGGEVGTSQIGLALYHQVESVTALTENNSIRRLKTADASAYINHMYTRPEVTFLTATLRAFLRQTARNYALIVLPTTGEDFGGLKAASPDSLLTIDTFRLCFDRLHESGMLAITTHAHAPPRESLRLLNMFIDVLQESGRDARHHIAVIRNWATVTLLAAKARITAEQAAAARSFAEQRGFDLVWLPDLNPAEVNRHHILDEAQYYLAARSLLASQNRGFSSAYVYDLAGPTDNRPFFHHFSRLRQLADFSAQLGKRSRAYLELGLVLLVAALFQAAILALVLIVLPLIPAIGLPGSSVEQLCSLGFFGAIGLGFMLLEMGLLQRLTLYLGHPVYAAAAVLSGFLFFGGLGSLLSSRLQDPLTTKHCGLALIIAVAGVALLLLLEKVLPASEGLGVAARILVVLLLTGPPAVLMGMMFPLGLRRLGRGQAGLIPWAWSVNGFTSVLATLCAPLIAMQWGFAAVAWVAVGCYLSAALLSLGLPGR